ncbi:hypothetical protein EC988_003763 [Linderina pennispora]|nr:hypothetical protein EC988_003763 [Linderina pennispora]
MVSVPAGGPQPTANKVNNHQTLAISKYDPISMPQGPRSAPLLRTETKQEQNPAIQQQQHQQQQQPVRPVSELQYSATSRSRVTNHRSMSQPVPPRSSISQSTEVLPLAMVPCQRSSTTVSMAGTSSSSSSSANSVRLPPISDLFNAVEQISKRRPANTPSSVELSGARGRYMGEPWGRTSGLRSTIRGPGGYLSGNNDMTEHK